MVGKSGTVVPAVIDSYDFAGFNVIADIGGHVIADAADVASSRLSLVPGDFFGDPLPVADAYVLMEVIHDWANAEAERILKAVRRAAPEHARLLIVEALIGDMPGPHFGKLTDIIMLAVTGGRERTRTEYEVLLRSTGFRLTQVVPTRSQYSIVEAVPA
jgi:hypothetical protein